MEGRSQHKSQEMGTIERRGPQTSGLRLVSGPSRTDGSAGAERLRRARHLAHRPARAGRTAGRLACGAARRGDKGASTAALHDLDPLRSARHPARRSTAALAAVRQAQGMARRAAAAATRRAPTPTSCSAIKEAQLTDAIVRLSGLEIDVLTDRESAAPGESARVSVNAYVPDGAPVDIASMTLRAPAGWATRAGRRRRAADASENPLARFFRETPTRTSAFRVTVPPTAPFSQPYWLATPRTARRVRAGARLQMKSAAVRAAGRRRRGVAARWRRRAHASSAAPSIATPIRFEARSAEPSTSSPAVTVAFDERLHLLPTRDAGRAASRRRAPPEPDPVGGERRASV